MTEPTKTLLEAAREREQEYEPSAHEILLTHVTNVSEVTANVIRRAVKEYEALAGLRMEPVLLQLEAMRGQMDELRTTVLRYAENQQNGSSR